MGTSTIAAGDSYISDTNGTVTSVSGTANQITVTNGTTTPVISITTSPVIPGSPTTTTQTTGDNSTKISTTAFVTTAINNAIAGVNPAVAVQAATTQASDTSGLTYLNGVAGIGATFTGSVNTPLVFDGQTLTALNQRVLIKNDTQSPSGAFNGVYYLSQLQTGILPPILIRALDYNTPSSINNTGAIPVVNGTLNALTSWILTSQVTTVGTDPLTYSKFSINPTTVTPPNLGGTGVANNAASTFTISGNFATTLTVTGVTALTLPTSGTLSVLGTAQTWTAAQRGAFSTFTDAATITLDMSLANNYQGVLGGSRILGVPTNPVGGQSGIITVRQDITGTRTLTYAWPYIFPLGVAPVLSTAKLAMDQLSYSINSYSTSAVTVTIAAPGVMTWTAHGLVSGQRIQLTTTGALPTGLAASTTYWITVIDANTFNLSTSLANAQAATFITTTGSQSGVHTATNISISIFPNLGLA